MRVFPIPEGETSVEVVGHVGHSLRRLDDGRINLLLVGLDSLRERGLLLLVLEELTLGLSLGDLGGLLEVLVADLGQVDLLGEEEREKEGKEVSRVIEKKKKKKGERGGGTRRREGSLIE